VAEILATTRLRLRDIEDSDAAFLLELLNSPGFVDNIGDRGVRTLADALAYIENNIRASYRRHGIGMWVVENRVSGTRIGLCGLLRRDTLEHPDVGYAFLPAAFGQGFATEAAGACLAHGRSVLGLEIICAIVAPQNKASIQVLNKIGLHYQRDVPAAEPGRMLQLFVS
jgi:[ribosomal protein S5]-alanine N-acetyltransferase